MIHFKLCAMAFLIVVSHFAMANNAAAATVCAEALYDSRLARFSHGTRDSQEPRTVEGLEPQVANPRGGRLSLVLPSGEIADEARSPTGEYTLSFNKYDPESRRLYIWGYSSLGWIEVYEVDGRWWFGESGLITPDLYSRPNDHDGITDVSFSRALGMLFYTGYTDPHWLTGRQEFHFYKIDGTVMRRVLALEPEHYFYRGDDPVAELAVVFREREIGRGPIQYMWFDGTNIIAPQPGFLPPMVFYSTDPQNRGDVLVSGARELYLWDGGTAERLFSFSCTDESVP